MAPVAVKMNLVFWAALTAAVLAPLFAGACDEKDKVSANVTPVKIAGKTFHLEVAADDPVRLKGLGDRTHIEDDGGMIFVFPQLAVRVQDFVMRDCAIDIDIIFTDGAGRVLATHEMKADPRKPEGEGKAGDMNNAAYNDRLKRYSSKYPSQFAIELKAGSIAKLGVKEGDLARFDHAALKKLAK